jgi:hypothetical protein
MRFLSIAVFVSFAWANSLAFAQQTPADLAGAPLAATRQTAIDARPFHRPLDAAKIRKWMEISSRTTMEEFELFLAPLTEDEERLVLKLDKMAAPIVNRLHLEDLRAVLKSGELTSFYVEEERGKHLVHTTPAIEDELYGAYDCVFASVGPPDGSPQYGEVVIRLSNEIRKGAWATPFSGMYFVYDIRHQDARKMQKVLESGKPLPTDPTNPLTLGFDDRLHFSHYVVIEDHWERALAYQAILVLRNADDSPAGDAIRKRFSQMLDEEDADKFWDLFIPARDKSLTGPESIARTPFGYLEGKFDNRVTTGHMTAIEVPEDKLEKVLAWPEAKPYRELIRAKPVDVP